MYSSLNLRILVTNSAGGSKTFKTYHNMGNKYLFNTCALEWNDVAVDLAEYRSIFCRNFVKRFSQFLLVAFPNQIPSILIPSEVATYGVR